MKYYLGGDDSGQGNNMILIVIMGCCFCTLLIGVGVYLFESGKLGGGGGGGAPPKKPDPSGCNGWGEKCSKQSDCCSGKCYSTFGGADACGI